MKGRDHNRKLTEIERLDYVNCSQDGRSGQQDINSNIVL